MKSVRYRIKENLSQYADLYITCCIPVIPFSLSAHMLFYLSEAYTGEVGGFGNCMLLLSGALFIVCLAVFRYSLRAYIRQRAEHYSILLMLGISSRDFWLNFMAEYCPTFLLLLFGTAVGCSAVCNLIVVAAHSLLGGGPSLSGETLAGDTGMKGMFRDVSKDMFVMSGAVTLLLILLFALGMLGSVLLLILRQWRKDLAQYLADISHGRETMHRFRIAYGVKIPAAGLCLALSFYLLSDYTVGKMILAAFLHMTGIYCMLQINGRLIRKLLGFRRKTYFRHLLLWNDLVYECRLNGNIMFAIYAVNFLLVFLFGGLLASDFPADVIYTVVKGMTAVTGLSVLLEEQAFLLEKMLLDLQKEKERRDILFQIGMGRDAWQKLLQDKLKMSTIVPMAAASVMGAVFFLCDYVYQADVTKVSQMWSITLLKYAGAVALFWLVQYGGYLFLRRRLLQKYSGD